jgi:hypothetical protein
MKQLRVAVLLSLFVLIACSCSRGVQVRSDSGLTAQGAETWLKSKMVSAPKADLTGKWDAGSAFAGGWGEGNFIQEKANFFGTLGLYNIKGVVSGTAVHFVLMSNGTVYYTGEMSKKSAGSYAGKAVKGAFADAPLAVAGEVYPITFQKMN